MFLAKYTKKEVCSVFKGKHLVFSIVDRFAGTPALLRGQAAERKLLERADELRRCEEPASVWTDGDGTDGDSRDVSRFSGATDSGKPCV